MAAGRREESRMHALTQAVLVWGPDIDQEAFLKSGDLGEAAKVELDTETQVAVEEKVSEYFRTGKLIVESP